MEGILKRKISIFRGYQDRWFVLTDDGLMKQYEVNILLKYDLRRIFVWFVLTKNYENTTYCENVFFSPTSKTYNIDTNWQSWKSPCKPTKTPLLTSEINVKQLSHYKLIAGMFEKKKYVVNLFFKQPWPSYLSVV